MDPVSHVVSRYTRDNGAQTDPEHTTLDVVGIGIGPFNLSVAALLEPLQGLTSMFLERDAEFRWHPGLLFPDASIQVSFLKDLVTLADPASRYSFLSFLAAHKRLYRFINANFPRVTRQEFERYFRWVCGSLGNLRFGRTVRAVEHDGNAFSVCFDNGRVRARNLILGSGLTPFVPESAVGHLGEAVFHAVEFLDRPRVTAGRRVAVIGGGQTGAEVVAHLLSNDMVLPEQLHWITRRPNFLPLDESPFTNELFTPNYSDHFYDLPAELRRNTLETQKLASDGIPSDLLERIYRRMYSLEFLEGHGRICALEPGLELVNLSRSAHGYDLHLRHAHGDMRAPLAVDMLILCTGFEYRIPDYLTPLLPRIEFDRDGFSVERDFSIVWDGPAENRMYVQNAARPRRGVADPNLSLMAWRSATIVNSLAGKRIYDLEGSSSAFDWRTAHAGTCAEEGLHANTTPEP